MRSTYLIFLVMLKTLVVFSQNENRSIYSGGMLLFQPGYTLTSNEHQTIHENSNAIGGILRFYFMKHLTAGVYGGNQRTRYSTRGSENSYMSIGYGGPFIGVSKQNGNFRFTLSAFAGKGTLKNLHIEKQTEYQLTDSFLYVQSVMLFSPILSMDYSLSKRILLTFQAVCLTGKLNNGSGLYNPTLQFGVLMNR